MGSGTSTPSRDNHGPLRCPEGDDPKNFKRICMLFDSLDRDADMGVNWEESKYVAETYIQNCIHGLSKRQSNIQRQLEHDHMMADEKHSRAVNAAESEYTLAIANAQLEYNRALASAEATLEAANKSITLQRDEKLSAADASLSKEKSCATNEHGDELGKVTGKIQWYSSLAPEDKGRAFIKAICGDEEGTVGFWKFYEWMKRNSSIASSDDEESTT